MIQFLNSINSHISRDFFKVFEKMNKMADQGINDRELTRIEEIKFLEKLKKIFPAKLGNFPELSELNSIDKEILYLFNKLEIYPSDQHLLLNKHLELIQEIHETAYSTKSLELFAEFCEKNKILYVTEFKSEMLNGAKNIRFIKFFILATLFSHLDVVINKQLQHIQPICLNELFRYRLNPLTSEIKENLVVFKNKKSKFVLPTRQFIKYLALWQNFDQSTQTFPSKARGIKLRPIPDNSPYISKIRELLRDIENTKELLPIYYEDVPVLLTGYNLKNSHFDDAASEISDNFQFHLLGVWLIYIFQNYLGQSAKNYNELPVTTLWLDLWESFHPLYDLDKNADHLIKWPADFIDSTKSID